MKKIPTALRAAEKIVSIVIVVFFCGIVHSGCSSNSIVKDNMGVIPKNDSTQKINVQSPTYVFQPGDQLRITIRGNSDLDTTTVIGDAGTISMRLIGEVQAAGITRAQLTDNITSKLSMYIKTEIHPFIVVLNALIYKVAVLGAVGKQDNYAIATEINLLQVLAMAGGATAEADLQHTKIFRNGNLGIAEEIDLTKYITNGDLKDIPMVKPGDIIYVPREENIVRELSSFFRDTIFLFTLFTVSQ